MCCLCLQQQTLKKVQWDKKANSSPVLLANLSKVDLFYLILAACSLVVVDGRSSETEPRKEGRTRTRWKTTAVILNFTTRTVHPDLSVCTSGDWARLGFRSRNRREMTSFVTG